MHTRAIRIVSAAASAALLFTASTARAQDVPAPASMEEGPGDPSLSVILKQDRFFGFHSIAQVGVPVADTLDVTFYGIFWTIPAFGAGGGGQNLWTEWGAGANFNLLDGNLSVNPQVGVLSGNLLSATFGANDVGNIFEGIVPNITMTYGDGLLEGQFYGGWYIALRDGTNGSTADDNNHYIHYWANAGISLVSWLSVGVHWEHLLQTEPAGVANRDLYQFIGPYVEAKAKMGFLRFAAGADVAPDDLSDFYQMSVGVSI